VCSGTSFVAVGGSGSANILFRSLNGVDWTVITPPVLPPSINPYDWQYATYGNGLYVVASESASEVNILVSADDGLTWTFNNGGGSNVHGIEAIAFGNGLFVVLEKTNTNVYVSPDGVNWNLYTSASSTTWLGLVYNQYTQTFVAVGYGGTYMYGSRNGKFWNTGSITYNTFWTGIAYDNYWQCVVAFAAFSSNNLVASIPAPP